MIKIGISAQDKCILEIPMVIGDIATTERDDSIPGILKLHPGVRARTPDLRSGIIGVTPG